MRVALFALALAVSAPVTAQSVKAGIDAWTAGRADEAVAIWRPLAAHGNSDAAYNLAQAYKLGRGAPADLAMAQRYYEQAAKVGHLEAQTSLGLLLFQNGNRADAMKWLASAARLGEPRAMLVYGTALFNGEGVPQDAVQAYAYVSRSAAQGLAPAKVTLAEMDKLVPLEQRQAGVKLAQQWAAETSPVKSKAAKVASVKPKATAPTAAKPIPALPGPAPSGAFRIQLGAFRDRATAQALFAKLRPRLGGATMVLSPSGAMTRLQAGPYASRAAASAACAALRPQPCFPVPAR